MQQYNDVPNRKIIISSVIDDTLAEEVISAIMDINDYDAKMSVLNTYAPQPIEIYINSVGGNVSDGFAIISAMEMSETPIVTFGMGIVASMALGVFLAGDVRVSARHTRFMYHTISYGMLGYIQDHEDMQAESDLLQRMYDSLVIDNTNIKKERLQEIRRMKKDFYFSGKEAVELGVAHHVVLKTEKNIKATNTENITAE